jgi:hypothetical protein
VSKPWVVDDELWALIEPVLPPWPQQSPGPRPVEDRLCLQGILFVCRPSWASAPVRPAGVASAEQTFIMSIVLAPAVLVSLDRSRSGIIK